MKTVSVTLPAEQDIESSALYYERQQPGLGTQFVERVAEAIDRIRILPAGYQVVFERLRRVTLRQFREHALWYKMLPNESLIVACLSSRMSPDRIREIASGIRPIRQAEQE